MTPYWSPSRLFVEGQPCWLGSYATLPDLFIRPSTDSPLFFTVLTWVHREGSIFTPLQAQVASTDLHLLALDWAEGPEEALQKWFGFELRAEMKMEARREEMQNVAQNLEDLGL